MEATDRLAILNGNDQSLLVNLIGSELSVRYKINFTYRNRDNQNSVCCGKHPTCSGCHLIEVDPNTSIIIREVSTNDGISFTVTIGDRDLIFSLNRLKTELNHWKHFVFKD